MNIEEQEEGMRGCKSLIGCLQFLIHVHDVRSASSLLFISSFGRQEAINIIVIRCRFSGVEGCHSLFPCKLLVQFVGTFSNCSPTKKSIATFCNGRRRPLEIRLDSLSVATLLRGRFNH